MTHDIYTCCYLAMFFIQLTQFSDFAERMKYKLSRNPDIACLIKKHWLVHGAICCVNAALYLHKTRGGNCTWPRELPDLDIKKISGQPLEGNQELEFSVSLCCHPVFNQNCASEM